MMIDIDTKVIAPKVVTDAMLVSSSVPETDYTAYNSATAYAIGDKCMVAASHLIYESLIGSKVATATMTIASPCVVTLADHGLITGTPVFFTTTGALPTGIVASAVYYVLSATASTFTLSSTLGGDAVNTSGTQSGTHTAKAGNVNKTPADNPIVWLELSPTNRWGMFDDVVGTATTVATSLTVVLSPGAISGLSLMELVGRTASVSLKNATGGDVVYTRTINLDGTLISSVYDWFFSEYEQQTAAVFTDLPAHYSNPELTITLSTTTGNVSCGVCKFGEAVGLGSAQYGATSGIVDYSVKTTDEFGRTSVTRRTFSKRMTLKLMTNKSDYTRISRKLAGLRSTPAVWIATDAAGYEPLIIYGFYKDFSIDVAYPELHYCNLEVEGLI